MSQPTAKVIAASVGRHGKPIYTLEVVFHRTILAEMNTHRVFSRSYRSSRAVPVEKLVEEVRESPWYPTKFGSAQKGMVSGPEIGDVVEARLVWKYAAKDAASSAEALADLGVHKEEANRLIEPFLPAVGVITSTEWDNFFTLRCAPNAAPEMQAIAWAMRFAMKDYEPDRLRRGEWHLPYVTEAEMGSDDIHSVEQLRMISAARCARTSYGNQNVIKTVDEEIAMARRLWRERHYSPFEHQSRPALFRWWRSANFRGWIQSRHAGWWEEP